MGNWSSDSTLFSWSYVRDSLLRVRFLKLRMTELDAKAVMRASERGMPD